MSSELEHDYIMGYLISIDKGRIRLRSFDNHYKLCYALTDAQARYIWYLVIGDNIVVIKRSIPDKIILDWCIL